MFQIIQTQEFLSWLDGLRNLQAKDRILARLVRMQLGNFGDTKPVGGGVSEARIHVGAGYRLYFITRGNSVVVMLAGGDKASQKRDINRAISLAEQWR